MASPPSSPDPQGTLQPAREQAREILRLLDSMLERIERIERRLDAIELLLWRSEGKES